MQKSRTNCIFNELSFSKVYCNCFVDSNNSYRFFAVTKLHQVYVAVKS